MPDKNRSKGYDQSPDYGFEIGRLGVWLAVPVPVFVVTLFCIGLIFRFYNLYFS